MPGVVVTTDTRSNGAAPLAAPSGQFFAVGLCARGDTTQPILVRGMADVVSLLGPRPTYGALWDQLATFFAEGGEQAWVSRAVGPAATKGTLTLQDRNGVAANTLKIDATSEGSWSSGISVEVRDGGLPNTFRIIVTQGATILKDLNNIVNPADAQTRFSGDPYIKVTSLGSASTAPANNPKVLAPTALSAGSDDRTSVTTAILTAGLNDFGPGLGDGAVAIPGSTGSVVWSAIDAHCRANNRIGLLAGALGDSIATYISNAASLDTEFCGLFGPYVGISDGAGGIRYIAPEGFVAAKRAQAHKAVGPWRAPAGSMGKALSLLGVETVYSNADGDNLDNGSVSVIRLIKNSVRLYGWRSLSSDEANYAYLKDRDLLNRLVIDAEGRLEDYVYDPIDVKGQLQARIKAELMGMVEPIAQAGGLYARYDDATPPNIIDPGYLIETGNEVNSAQTLANNEVHARLSVRISPTGALVSLNIVKVGVLAGF